MPSTDRSVRRRRLLLLLGRAAASLCSGGGLLIFIILLSWYNDRESKPDAKQDNNSAYKYLPVVGLAVSAFWNLFALVIHGMRSAAWLSHRVRLYADVACAVELAALGYVGFIYDVLTDWRTGGYVPFSEKRVEVIGVTLMSLSGAAHLVFFCYGCFDEPEQNSNRFSSSSQNRHWTTQLQVIKSVRSDDSACDTDSFRGTAISSPTAVGTHRETGDSSNMAAPYIPYQPATPPPVHFAGPMVPAPLSVSHSSTSSQQPYDHVPVPVYTPGYYGATFPGPSPYSQDDTFADQYPLPIRDSDSTFSVSTSMLSPRAAPLPPVVDRKPTQTPTLPPPISPLTSPSLPPAIPPRTPRPLRVETASTPLAHPRPSTTSLRSRGNSTASSRSTAPYPLPSPAVSSLNSRSNSHRLFSSQNQNQSFARGEIPPVSPISSPPTPASPGSGSRSRSHSHSSAGTTAASHGAPRHRRSRSSVSRLAGLARRGTSLSGTGHRRAVSALPPTGKTTPVGGEREESEAGMEEYLPGGYVTNLEMVRSEVVLGAFGEEVQGRGQGQGQGQGQGKGKEEDGNRDLERGMMR